MHHEGHAMGRIDLSTPGHWLEPWHRWGDANGAIAGYIENHPNPTTGKNCCGSITLETPERPASVGEPRWRLVAGTPEAPLTLEPSILCRTCGAHGWIRDGAWVPA